MFDLEEILATFDECSSAFTFPMMDNGYVYMAATRLALFRAATNWAMTIEVFGYSPRSGLPDTAIYTFSSALHARKGRDNFASQDAYDQYLKNNPLNELSFVFPIDDEGWMDEQDPELVAVDAMELSLRKETLVLPPAEAYSTFNIDLVNPPRVHVFELCRYLAESNREAVLATREERRTHVAPDAVQLLQLEEWHHPDLVSGQSPSDTDTFKQLAQVLATGNVDLYRPTEPPNTHWSNWPEGGLL